VGVLHGVAGVVEGGEGVEGSVWDSDRAAEAMRTPP
jgi:hypothetical protein